MLLAGETSSRTVHARLVSEEAVILALSLAPACLFATDMLTFEAWAVCLPVVCVTEEGYSILQSLGFKTEQCLAGCDGFIQGSHGSSPQLLMN